MINSVRAPAAPARPKDRDAAAMSESLVDPSKPNTLDETKSAVKSLSSMS